MDEGPGSLQGESVDDASGESRSPSPILKIETEERGTACVVRLSGEVDLETVTLLRGALDGRIHNRRNVILDCQRLKYIDSAGLNLLADLYRHGRRFVFVAHMPIQKTLTIMGLDMLMPVASSVEEALNVLTEEG